MNVIESSVRGASTIQRSRIFPPCRVTVNNAAPEIRSIMATCQKTRQPGSHRKKAGSVHANAAPALTASNIHACR